MENYDSDIDYMSTPPLDNTLSVMVVDDHPSMLMGMVSLIEAQADMEIVAQANSGQEAIDLYAEKRPDIVLMDLRMPGQIGGVEAIIGICKGDPEARVIVLSTYDFDEDIYRAIQSGAKSYLLKDMSIDQIASTIREVYKGNSTLPATVAERLSERSTRKQLTERERDVLKALIKGRSNKEIAASLFISEDTVKSHLKTLFAKLNVHDRTEAAISAIRHGIIHLD